MTVVHDPIHAGKPGRAGSRLDRRTTFVPVDATRPTAPRKLVRAMVVDLAARYSVRLRLAIDDGKAVRS